MDDPVEIAIAVEEQMSELSGISVELMAEDLQTWTKDLYLTPSGLMARMVGVNRRSLFLALYGNKY